VEVQPLSETVSLTQKVGTSSDYHFVPIRPIPYYPKRIMRAIGDENALAFRQRGAKFGFYRQDDLENPNSLNVKYHLLKDTIHEFAAFLGEYRNIFIEALQNSDSA